MEIRFNIQGEGKVEVEGNIRKGNSVTLHATPVEPMRFGYYQIGDMKIMQPIYVYQITSDEDVEIIANFYLPMEEYLKALFDYDIKKSTLLVAASNHKFSLYDDEQTVSQEKKDLAQSDILYAICTSPSTIQGRSEKVGDWQSTAETRGLTATDKKDMRSLANYLREKWGKKQVQTTTIIRGWN